jgi:hypothetical protein
MPQFNQLNVGDYVRILPNIKDSLISNDMMKNCVNYVGRIVGNYSENYYQLELLSSEKDIQDINDNAFSWCVDWLEFINPPQFKVGEKVKSKCTAFDDIYEIIKLKFDYDILYYDLSDGKGGFYLSLESNLQKLMESKYKVGQVVTIAEYLESFKESEHRHLTEVMKEAYKDFALIVDVKPAEGLTDSKDDGFNYYLKIYRDRTYVKECESEYWTSDLFEECATPLFKINDIVHFNSDQYDKTIIYRVDSYYKDTDDDDNLAVGYYLVDATNPDNEYYADADEAEHLELVNVEQVNITNPSLEEKLCSVKSDVDIIADYNAADVEFTKQQIIKLQQKVEENENRLRKQEESIAGSGRPGELGILNPGNKTRSRNPEAILTTISLNSRKRVGFFED